MASPVTNVTGPLRPALEVPVRINISPLIPDTPESCVTIIMFPVFFVMLIPEESRTSPPGPAAAEPPEINTSPPRSKKPRPCDRPPFMRTAPPFPPFPRSWEEPSPPTIFISPPEDLVDVVAPADTVISPPSPESPTPTTISMEPAAPFVAAPVSRLILPLLPWLAVPVTIDNPPLTP